MFSPLTSSEPHRSDRPGEEAAGQATAAEASDYRLLGNQGNALWLADRPHAALLPYRQAVLRAPGEPVLYRGLGNVLTDLGAFEEADRAYQLSRRLDDRAITAWNHSQLLVGLERYAEAYALAERRWELAEAEIWRDRQQAWRGQPNDWQAPLLVWSEQGLGDTLQHLRWLGPLQQRRGSAAPALLLEVEPCLVELLRLCLSQLTPAPVVRPKPADGPPLPWRGCHVSLLSLPWLLGGAPLPAGATWLQAAHWRQPSGSKRVGVVWAAGCKATNPVTVREYRRRSLDSAALARLLDGLRDLGCRVMLLQFGADRDQAAAWRETGMEALPADADFACTAEVVAALDLVITVDTAMAHLVGAMRRPAWVLLPFSAAPRWLRDRQDSPWYPTARLFRQPRPGDWTAVVDAVLQAAELGFGPLGPRGEAADVSYDARVSEPADQ